MRDPNSKPSRKTPTERQAFSLVELLVVLGIIGALIGILAPALSAAQREGRKTACKSNLRQIGSAFTLYTQQYKSRYPKAPSLPSVNPYKLNTLQEFLAPHLANGAATAKHHVDQGTGVFQVFHCPADETVFPDEKTSYFYHQELGERPIQETFLFQVYKDVHRVPLLWDADNFHGGTVPFNWLFCDGHIESWLEPTTK